MLNLIKEILKDIDTIEEIRTASDKKRTKITADKILNKYKKMKRPKKTYIVYEEDIKTIYHTEPKEDLFAGESIVNAANKVLNFKQFKKEQEKELKKGKKGKQIAAKNILKKYKNLKKPKNIYLVNAEDLETLNYDETQEDLFEGESILAAAKKVLDFDEFKPEQERKLQQYNDQLMNDAETINYVDDITLEYVRDNKNLEINTES